MASIGLLIQAMTQAFTTGEAAALRLDSGTSETMWSLSRRWRAVKYPKHVC